MTVVGLTFSFIHLQILQFLSSLLQPWSRRVFFDMPTFQIVHPFFEWSLGNLVELIDTNNEVFGKNFLWGFNAEDTSVAGIDSQRILRMHSYE